MSGFDDMGHDPDISTGPTPFDRLTELCNTMTKSIELPENEDVRGIVFLSDPDRSGIQMFGFEEPSQGIAELFVHMKAIFASMGKELDFIGIPESPAQMEDNDG